MNTQTAPIAGKGWGWFPWVIAGVLCVVVAVNGTLLYFAKTTFPGVAANQPYETGIAYNSVLANAERQEAMGWRVTNDIADRHIVVTILDRAGASIDRIELAGDISRPVGPADAHPLTFSRGPDGVFRADQAIPAPGQWDLKLAAHRDGAVAYAMQRRLIAP